MVTGAPTVRQPSYGVHLDFAYISSAVIFFSASRSSITRSASDPISIQPFLGYNPSLFAGQHLDAAAAGLERLAVPDLRRGHVIREDGGEGAFTQEVIDGTVFLKLFKGKALAVGRESTSSLYDQNLSSMDLEGGFQQQDSEGFIRINAIRLMAHHAIMRRKHMYWGAEPESGEGG